MTKADLATAVLEQVGEVRSRTEASDLVNEIFSIIKENLTHETNVMVSAFGKFDTREKKERLGRNPATGKPILIEARRVVRFKPSVGLKELMNASQDRASPKDEAREVVRLDAPGGQRAALERRFV